MSTWFRAFGAGADELEPKALLVQLKNCGFTGAARFHFDEQGWFRADLDLGEKMPALRLDRYLVSKEDIRSELNTWAAWLETVEENPNQTRLMELMVSAQQMLTCCIPAQGADAATLHDLCVALFRILAERTAGVYQVDREGFFAADGTLLVTEY